MAANRNGHRMAAPSPTGDHPVGARYAAAASPDKRLPEMSVKGMS
jgi:hypothetical protein